MKNKDGKSKKLQVLRKGKTLREIDQPDLANVNGGKQAGVLGIGCGGPDECIAHHQY
ncbi:MAG: hypothetical protein K0V04_07535 [Deltaproteobacteria bacterium]|nr:hypothetical protein [Deltaproteobacteria bacterium]